MNSIHRANNLKFEETSRRSTILCLAIQGAIQGQGAGRPQGAGRHRAGKHPGGQHCGGWHRAGPHPEMLKDWRSGVLRCFIYANVSSKSVS